MYPCKTCKTNKWKYGFNDETRKVQAICLACGEVVEFNAKPRKPEDLDKIEACAEYEIRDGKHFLKIDGEFVEVEICKVNKKGQRDKSGKFMRVMPVIGNKITKIPYCHKTF